VLYLLFVAHLIHLDSSLRTDQSRSRKLSTHYAKLWQAKNPDGAITYRDLTIDPVPHLDNLAISSPLIAASERTPEQAAACAFAEQLAGEVIAADIILVGLPLYSFGAPSTFMAWFDRIVIRGLTMGLLADKEFVIVTARGGGYGPGTPREGWDHTEPWLRHALTLLGVSDPVFINTELTLARESPAMATLDLGSDEDKSLINALAAIDALVA
jgi:FMN-dependent NADH-azoreductase